VPAIHRLTQEVLQFRRRKRKPGVQKGDPVVAEQTEDNADAATHRIVVCRRDQPAQSKCERDCDVAVMFDDRISALIPTERR